MEDVTHEKLLETEIAKRTEAINDAFLREKKAGAIEVISTTERNDRIENMLAEIPREELREEVRDQIQVILESNRDEKTKVRLAEKACKHVLMSYMDSRDYLGMPNREFVEYKIFRTISESIEKKQLDPKDLYKVARINFDLNGLKTMNDVGGHSRGNIGLLIFGGIIREGKTALWLKKQGIEIAPSAEGGDEFGLVIYGNKDLRPLLPEIEKRFIEEVSSTRDIQTLKITKELDEKTGKRKTKIKAGRSSVDDIIRFDDPADIQKMKDMGIIDDKEKKLPEDFKFQLGTSIGSTTFGEALGAANLDGVKSYADTMKRVINQMFLIADRRAIINKDEGKKRLETENPTLFRMYNRVSKEVVELNKQLISLAKTIEQLTAINVEETRKRTEAQEELIKLKSKILELEMGWAN
ncbi:MAG: hypothetical protein HY226_00415 [Candidatus Vogelbacteria bacterium]|nr:hypothetical protein [Candidatus Vogelbacteria bacterium]